MRVNVTAMKLYGIALFVTLSAAAPALAQRGRGNATADIADLPYALVEWPAAPTTAAGVPGAWNFIQAASVAVTPRGTILVLHRGAQPLMEFDSSGKFLRSWATECSARARSPRFRTSTGRRTRRTTP